MIVLDTNVLSEPLRARPDPRVMGWLLTIDDVAVTAISVGELLNGARRLPAGRRRRSLLAAIDDVLSRFADRVLAYDEQAARVYAELQERRRAAGTPLSVEDGMIGAVCRSCGGMLATRNVSDFTGLDLDLINPWDEPAR